jgi:hypothetical protein
MGGSKISMAICSWFDCAYGPYKYIKASDNHTGGGDSDDLGSELDSIEKEGPTDQHKCSTTTKEHFKSMGWYILFNEWYVILFFPFLSQLTFFSCGSKPDITKTTDLDSTKPHRQSVPKHPCDGGNDPPGDSTGSDADDKTSNAGDPVPCGKCHHHAAHSTGQDVIDEKVSNVLTLSPQSSYSLHSWR